MGCRYGMLFILLETSRLIIIKFKNTDVCDWAKIENDADIRRFVDGKVLSFEEAAEYVRMNIRYYPTYNYGTYVVR